MHHTDSVRVSDKVISSYRHHLQINLYHANKNRKLRCSERCVVHVSVYVYAAGARDYNMIEF